MTYPEARIPETPMQIWTPGPWFIGDTYCDDEGHPEIPIHASNGRGGECTPASVVLQFPTVEGMQEANARLIAAAPELYAALDAIKRFGELGCVQLPDFYPPGGKKPASKDVWQFPRHMLTDIDAALAKARGEP